MLAISRQTGRKCCADFSCKPGPTTRLPGNCFRAGAHEPAVVVSDSAAGARPAIRPAAYRARRGRGRSVQRRPNPQLRQRRFTSWRRPTGPGRARTSVAAYVRAARGGAREALASALERPCQPCLSQRNFGSSANVTCRKLSVAQARRLVLTGLRDSSDTVPTPCASRGCQRVAVRGAGPGRSSASIRFR